MGLQAAVTRVDQAAARARYSAKLRGQPVRFCAPTDLTGLQLPSLRHPLLVWRSTSESPDASRMVPMDICVPASVRSVVITGPNTGGKTICLKTLGLAALMAKAGLRVLCEPPPAAADGRVLMPHYGAIMADIGDDQSIVQSLSTFSAHVARMRRIMECAGRARGSALVLLDEVGSGTDPTEGSALGMAVLRQLADDAALTLATTHHGRLKSLKFAPDANGRFENACVEFDVASMAPTYRLLWGIPGRSNALAIAERLGLQPAVVEDARGLLSEESDASVEVIVDALQAQKEEQRVLNVELAALRDSTRVAGDEVARTQARLKAREEAMRDGVRKELEAELAQARAEIAELVRRAQQAESGTQDGRGKALRETQQVSQELARLGEKQRAGSGGGGGGSAAPAADDAPVSAASIAAGDKVLVPRLGDTLVDVESRKGGQLFVVFGGLKMKVKAAEVTKVVRPAPPPSPPKKAKPAATGKGGGNGPVVKFASNTLDLRGRYAGEIEAELGRAIDSAASTGSLWVIHGHGTGSLKKAVRDLLRSDPMVKRIEDAPQSEGGSGCTVAILK